MKQSRWRSPVFWGALVAQIISIGQLAGVWKRYGIDVGAVGDAVAGILQLGVIVGLLNDPTSKSQF